MPSKRRKQHHKCKDKVCFHGGFTLKSDAQKKAKAVGGRVKFMFARGWRYVVMTTKGKK